MESSEIGLSPLNRPRRAPRTRTRRWTAWTALPVAAIAATIGEVGARLATDYVDERCPAGPTHEVGYVMMLLSVFALTPVVLVLSALALRRGPAAARVAAVAAIVLVVVLVGHLYSLAYHWDIQCSTH